MDIRRRGRAAAGVAGLVSEQRRGAVTGMLLSGLLGGILLARTFSGTLGG